MGGLAQNHRQLPRVKWRNLLLEEHINTIKPKASARTSWRRLNKVVENLFTTCGISPPFHSMRVESCGCFVFDI